MYRGSCFAAALAVLALAGAMPSSAAVAETVRVLLFQQSDSVRVRTSRDAPWLEIRAVEGGVQVVGEAASPLWRGRSTQTIALASGGRRLEVRGAVEVFRDAKGLSVVNELPIESYLAGSLGREMYASWKPAALRAQAVASRSYAQYRIRAARRSGSARFDLTADTGSQVYGGVAAESQAVRDAVEATRGQILSHRGQPILAAFHSASGGITASSDEVWGAPQTYLITQDVSGEDDSPDTYWRAAISRTTLGRAVAGLTTPVGEIRKLRVLARSASGRVARLRATGTRGTVDFTGRELRRALGESTLRSTLFEVRQSEDGFVFVGSGRGHGVGMSQWGARALAERGASYQQILSTFYPTAQLERGTVRREKLDEASPLALAGRSAQ